MSGRNTATRDKHRAVILKASTICWLCGHDGADAVDHKIPLDSAKEKPKKRDSTRGLSWRSPMLVLLSPKHA